MTTLYSQAKPLWHQDRLESLRRGIVPPPVHINFIISDLCNQDCSFCAYRMSNGLSHENFVGNSALARIGRSNPQRQVPTLKAMEIIDDCAEIGVKAIEFTGGGEPTAHPDHLDLFFYAQMHGIETGLVTNGVKLSAGAGVRGMQWIRVSVDAGSPETYARVRNTPARHWDMVWDNIATLAARDFKGVLGVGFVVTPDNYREIATCAKLAREAGAHNLRIGAVYSKDGNSYYDGVPMDAVEEQVALAVQEARPGFEVFNLWHRRTGELVHGAPTSPDCWYQHLNVYIGGDLNVYRCCNTAYTTAGKVGSLVNRRFRDVMQMDYHPFDARSCQYCQFRGQNEIIQRALDGELHPAGDPPTHVNFV